jgi:hypothetical protein
MAYPFPAISLATARYMRDVEGMGDWLKVGVEGLAVWPLRALQERRRALRERLGQWHRFESNELALKEALRDVEREMEQRR